MGSMPGWRHTLLYIAALFLKKNPNLFPCSVLYQIMAYFPLLGTYKTAISKEKKLANKRISFGQVQRINVGENSREMIDTLICERKATILETWSRHTQKKTLLEI